MALSERRIELSKVKIVALVFGAGIFVALGIWMLTFDVQTIESSRRFNSPTIVYGIAIVAIVFFGLCGLVGIKKMRDKTPGLVLSPNGIVDNSSGVSGGIIPWSEVVDIAQHQVQRQKFVSIHVRDPEKYVNSGNVLRRLANRANMKMCGTPINISANTLKIGHEDLLATVEEYYRNSRDGV